MSLAYQNHPINNDNNKVLETFQDKLRLRLAESLFKLNDEEQLGRAHPQMTLSFKRAVKGEGRGGEKRVGGLSL